MVNIQNDMKKVVRTQVFSSFGAQMALAPKLSNIQVLNNLVSIVYTNKNVGFVLPSWQVCV